MTRVREEQDAIDLVRRRLLEDWKLSEDELKAMDSKVRETVDEASEFATNDPEPDPSELHTEILLYVLSESNTGRNQTIRAGRVGPRGSRP